MIRKLAMWHWFRHRIGGLGQTAQGTLFLGKDLNVAGTTRKGKSIISGAFTAVGAEDGDTVAINRDGQARIVGRAPRVVVDNTK